MGYSFRENYFAISNLSLGKEPWKYWIQAREVLTHTNTKRIQLNNSIYTMPEELLKLGISLKEAARLRLTTHTFSQWEREDSALVFLTSVFLFPSPINESRIFQPSGLSIGYTSETCVGYTGLLNLDEAVFALALARHVSRKANASVYIPRAVIGYDRQ